MKWSIIIPTFNKWQRLNLVLCALEFQTYDKSKFEVIVVDDGSEDETRNGILGQGRTSRIKYIRTEHIGRAAARNIGINNAANEFLLFIDDDTVFSNQFIEYHARTQQKHPCVNHGKIINVGMCRYLNNLATGELFPDVNLSDLALERLRRFRLTEADIMERFDETIGKNKKVSEFENIIETVFSLNKAHLKWLGFTGGNVSLPKAWIEEAGKFDENFGQLWGCEDIELGYRLLQKGKLFHYDEEAVNFHLDHYRASSEKEHLVNSGYFYKKHECKEINYIQGFIEKRIKVEELKMLLSLK